MSLKLEGFFFGADKTKLHYKYWPHQGAKQVLIVTHGQAEHGGCYQRLVDALNGIPLNIIAWDMRGHGKSEGQRGFVRDFQEYVEDLGSLIQFLKSESSLREEDILLLGHSMGGLVQLSFLSQNSKLQFKANILSSPLLGLSVEVPLIKDLAALLAKALLPQLTLFNEIEFENLTSDEAVLQEMKADVLRHDRISPSAYLGSIEAIQKLRQDLVKVSVPTFVQMPEKDLVVDSQATREFFKKLPVGRYKIREYPERKHEIYNDVGRDEVFRDLVQYIQQIIH